MQAKFWAGRRVLVTGHTGFKGAWLCWWLKHLGANVAGVALDPPTSPSLCELTGLEKEMVSTRADVREPAALDAAFRAQGPEIVFHLAAQSLVRESYRVPAETFDTNVIGTVNCLEAARQSPGVRAVLVVTTDKVYRNVGSSAGYKEDDELGGDDPYAASKACAELATHAYRHSFFNEKSKVLLATGRAGNVIGGGDWAADRLVPDAMRAFGASRRLGVRNPAFTRPWQHVLEPLRGYLMLAERLHAGDRAAATAWNFGPDAADVQPVSWVADRLAAKWSGGAGWERQGGEQPHEAAVLALDSAKARAELGWRPLLALESALDWVVEWHQGFARGGDARRLTQDQIGRYQAMVAQ